ncbi:transporter [Beijerinckia sp. L45]|uniref:transporter n=1 Tax=Beijerinckia sp. L45 TaxID=1641855 RepID=UPI00131AADBF|nr:transporter [Beijerinckia sp. L45]
MAGNNHKGILFSALLAVLSGSAGTASAASWTPPGVTMGLPLGSAFEPGLYVSNLTHYGTSPSKTVTADIPSLTWSPGWQLFGASYQASIIAEGLEVWIKPSTYKRDVFAPLLIPLSLSWNLGQGVFVSFSQGVYPGVATQTSLSTPGRTSGTAFEERAALSYLRDGWILSANTISGVTTSDAAGLKQPNYFNIDWTAAHAFGRWKLGFVGYGAWDIEKTPANATLGPGHTVAVGGLIGYDFGGATLNVEATHALVTGGNTNYGKYDTHVWARVTIPVTGFMPAAAKQLIATK